MNTKQGALTDIGAHVLAELHFERTLTPAQKKVFRRIKDQLQDLILNDMPAAERLFKKLENDPII